MKVVEIFNDGLMCNHPARASIANALRASYVSAHPNADSVATVTDWNNAVAVIRALEVDGFRFVIDAE